MADPFLYSKPAVADPARKAAAVTASDSTILDVTKGLFVGTAGNVAVLMADDNVAVTFSNVVAGSILPVRVTKVMATNTTASNIVALF